MLGAGYARLELESAMDDYSGVNNTLGDGKDFHFSGGELQTLTAYHISQSMSCDATVSPVSRLQHIAIEQPQQALVDRRSSSAGTPHFSQASSVEPIYASEGFPPGLELRLNLSRKRWVAIIRWWI